MQKRRFKLNDKYYFPNEIWIPKNINVSKIKFSKNVYIKKIPNYYFLDFKKKLSKIKLQKKLLEKISYILRNQTEK